MKKLELQNYYKLDYKLFKIKSNLKSLASDISGHFTFSHMGGGSKDSFETVGF